MYSLIALVVAFLVSGAISFGTGYHFGHASVAPLKAVIKQAEVKNATDTKANATVALDVGKDDKKSETAVNADERKQHQLEHELMVARSNLATERLVLGATADTGGGQAGAPVGPGYKGTVTPAHPAGGSDSCQVDLVATVDASVFNNAELKRAIIRRDACVTQYEAVQHRINGD